MSTRSRIVMALILLSAGTGCASPGMKARPIHPPMAPPMIGQAKTGAERVRLDQMHMMAVEDGSMRK